MKRPQISLRTTLLLTTILALFVGWFADHERLRRRLVQANRGSADGVVLRVHMDVGAVVTPGQTIATIE
jgi:hypothetical protein